MTWGMVAVAGATLVAGVMAKNSANKAAKGQQGAANQAMQASEQNYQRTAGNLNPYIDAGSSSLAQMQKLNSGDYSGFTQSPDYQFSLSQGLQGLDRGDAARGSLYSGGHSADVMNYAQGLASQNYSQYYNRLAGLAENGQNAASDLGSVGTGNAAAIGTAATNAANANANAAYANANQNTAMIGGLAGAFGQYMGGRNQSPTASSYGGGNSLGGSGTAPYQVSDGSFNGGFNLATAGKGG